MKRFFLIALIASFGLWSQAAGAHPPSKIELTYDKQLENLYIACDHVTKNPRDHYIRRIIVSKNGKEVKDLFFSSQTNVQEQVCNVPIALQAGDRVSVKAICSKAGYKEESLIINEEEKEAP